MNSLAFDKTFRRVRRTAFVGVIVGWLTTLTVFAGVGYVAWHFLQKVW